MGKVPGHGVCTDDGRARPAGPATQDPRSHSWEDFRNDRRNDRRNDFPPFSFTKMHFSLLLVKENGLYWRACSFSFTKMDHWSLLVQ